MFIGVRTRSNELIVVDQDTKSIKYVRIVRRVPEGERWDSGNLAWISMAPWNRGKDDPDVDGEVPDFDVSKGPGRRLTDEEKKEIEGNEPERLVHRAHLRRGDFEKYGYTDRCPGCSAMLRGLHGQPHSPACRARMEEALASDIRVKNAKVRLQERGERMKKGKGGMDESAKRKLERIEGQALVEEDPQELNKLFEQYRLEYLKAKGSEEVVAKKMKTVDHRGRMDRSMGKMTR